MSDECQRKTHAYSDVLVAYHVQRVSNGSPLYERNGKGTEEKTADMSCNRDVPSTLTSNQTPSWYGISSREVHMLVANALAYNGHMMCGA